MCSDCTDFINKYEHFVKLLHWITFCLLLKVKIKYIYTFIIANWKHLQKKFWAHRGRWQANHPRCISTLTVKLHWAEKTKKNVRMELDTMWVQQWTRDFLPDTGTLVTLETERADKCQFNKGSNKNTSRLDCVTLRSWAWGLWLHWLNHNLPGETSTNFKCSCFIRLQKMRFGLKNTTKWWKNKNNSND